MENLLDFGIMITLWVQSLGSWLAGPMKLFSLLGTEEFFLVLIPAIYWCIDPVLGLRFGLTIVLGNSVNAFFKLLLLSPRPYWYDQRVIAYAAETSFGLPSGHAQGSALSWGWLAANIRRKWAWIVAILLVFLIGFSRIFLGVHFFSDVLVGWLLGAIMLWSILKFEKPIAAWFKTWRFGQQILIVTLISLLIVTSGFILRMVQGDWATPAEWTSNAVTALPDEKPIDPLSTSSFISMGGVFLGMLWGAIWLDRRGGYNAQGNWKQYLARYVIGLIGLLILWMGLGAVFPRGEYLLSYGLRYLRYGLAGLWLTGLAPWLFQQLKLAETRKHSALS